MGLLHDAIEVLDAGAVVVPATAVLGRDPQPVAFARRADHGTVMFLLRRTTGDVMAIVALLGTALVLVPGQAAPGTSVARAAGDDIAVHSPRGHFIYLGELAAAGERVTLTARRPGVEQTAVFDPIGAR